MATELRQFAVNGKKVWVQVDTEIAAPPVGRPAAKRSRFENTSSDDAAPASKRGAAARAIESADVEGALSAVMGPVQTAMKALKPNELSVELKLGFKADAGVFIAKTGAEASVTIKAVWKPT